MSTEIILRMRHVRASGLCVKGARAWFEKHGLDFRYFVKNGMPISQAQALDDGFADKVVAFAQQEGASDE